MKSINRRDNLVKNMTNHQKIIIFLQALVKEAVDDGFLMRRITLIKYLYLLDVYMAQETGKKFTDINWIFWKFGPYSNDANALIDELVASNLVQEKVIETKYENDFVQYEPIKNSPTRKDVWKIFPPKVLVKIFNKDLSRFMDDTYKLLDYVYFDTEPMKNVNVKDKLKFDNLSKDIEADNIVLKPISNTKFNKMRKQLVKRTKLENEKLFPEFEDNLLEEFDKEFFKENSIELVSGKVVFK